MIKIQNINFQNKTIENVEANGETISNIEIKLLKTKFSITIIKEGQIIKKEIKKKKNEEVIKELYIQDEDEKIEIQEEIIEPQPIQEELIQPESIETPEPIEIQPEPKLFNKVGYYIFKNTNVILHISKIKDEWVEYKFYDNDDYEL